MTNTYHQGSVFFFVVIPIPVALNDDDSEVELDSLGSFFVHLIDTDCYQHYKKTLT